MQCYLHPEEGAVHICLSCNRPISDSCKEEFKGEIFCRPCYNEVRERKEHERVSFTTTSTFEGKHIAKYYGIVTSQVAVAVDIIESLAASIDIDGGRHKDYEKEFRRAKKTAMAELANRAKRLGANGVVALKLDVVPVKSNLFLVILAGTAVEVDNLD
ncbi:MAG TPA: YbjQ family protein [bacterium]|nr:YbjQ family protein [bacterium]